VHDRSKLYTSSPGLSKREAVELALRTLVKLQQQGEIRAFRGRLAWEGDLETQRLDHKSGELQA
jgi:Arc/MetJ family transcription regulator